MRNETDLNIEGGRSMLDGELQKLLDTLVRDRGVFAE